MQKKHVLKLIAIALIAAGCNSETNTAHEVTQSSTAKLPEGYTHKVINNRGNGVESTLGEYTIRLTSNAQESANPQTYHKGVVVTLNGQTSQTMPMQVSYLDKEIMVSIYDKVNQLVAVSEPISVTDVPVVVVEMNI